MTVPPSRQNNFDLIRLLAACQVVLAHAIGHTHLLDRLPPAGRHVFDAILLLPGVPIFFVISGFLITRSFERNPANLAGYFWRRALRIFPALWICLAFTLCALGYFGFLNADFLMSKTFAAWLTGQISFLQFYNPEHFRSFGLGVANGALWTITVELQFYAFIPILYYASKWLGKLAPALTAALFSASFVLYCMMDHNVNGPGGYTAAPTLWKLTFVTVLPHLWMFMLGIFIHRRFDDLRHLIEGKFLAWFAAYAAFAAVVHLFIPFRSDIFYLSYLPLRALLALATISAAYSARPLASKILHGTDISYGTYLYHSVVINILLELGLLATLPSVATVFAISITLAILSWFVVEKPALACKSFSPATLWSRLARRTRQSARHGAP